MKQYDNGYALDNSPSKGKDRHIGGRGKICPGCSNGLTPPHSCVFYSASGDLLPYAFLCGYIEKRGRITLTQEHGTFMVSGFDQEEKHICEGFDKLSDARKYFRTFPRTKKENE